MTTTNRDKKHSWDARRIAVAAMALLMAGLMIIPLVADIVVYGHATDVTREDLSAMRDDIDALREQKDNLATQQAEAEATLADLAEQENSAVERLNALEDQIGLLSDQINTTQEIIDEYDVMIEQTQTDLAEAQANLDSYTELFLERVRSMEEQGTVSYWEILFQSASFSDLLDRFSFVNDVMTYDNDVIDNLSAAREAVETLEVQLESEQSAQQEAKTQLEGERDELEDAALEQEAVVAEILANQDLYAAQIEELSTQQEALVGEISEAEQELAAQEAAVALEEQRQREEAERAAEEARRQQELLEQQQQQEQEQQEQENQDSAEDVTEEPSEPETPADEPEEPAEEPDPEPEEPAEEPDPEPEEPSGGSSSGSATGSAIISYAAQFVGNPYVWGGNSLTNGIDCSGYVHQVLLHFGISSPRQSAAFRSFGRSVSVSDMQVGDIVCYSGHVGFYAGNGQLLSALGKNYGITYCSVNYKPILAVRRAW